MATPSKNLAFQNFYQAQLTSDITSSDTNIPLDAVPDGSEGFLVIDPDSSSSREVIFFDSKTSTQVVCPSEAEGRGQDGTTASSHLSGTTVIMAPVAGMFEALQDGSGTKDTGWVTVPKLATIPVCKITRSTQETVANGTLTQLTFDTAEFDTDNMADVANNQIVIKTAGIYRVSVGANMPSGGGSNQMRININGSEVDSRISGAAPGTVSAGANGSFLLSLNVNDTISTTYFQESGSSSNAGNAHITAEYVSSA